MANKKVNNFGIILAAVITVIGLGCAICGFTMDTVWIICSVASIIIYALIMYYLFVGYKKPHGNLFRIVTAVYPYMFLCMCLVIALQTEKTTVDIVFATLYGVAAVSSGYAAGRLNKIISSSFIMTFIAIFLIVDGIYCLGQFENPVQQFASININLQWIVVLLAYNIRYKAHKEAAN